jgi:hypothetical protein
MKPAHVLMWIEDRIEYHTERAEHSRKLFEITKAKEDAKLLNRIFHVKYKLEWWDEWTFPHHESNIRFYEQLKKEASYCHKMNYDSMTIPKDGRKSFYNWADKNNIPY